MTGPSPSARKAEVRIAWALVEGRIRHISEFGRIPRGQRPEARCETCERLLIFRLGPVRKHHFAHHGSPDCALATYEGAAHYNTKRFIAAQLQNASGLIVEEPCRHGCGKGDLRLVAAEWDEVAVERLVHPVRPDILLLRRGVPIAAVEVRSTHAVSETKAEALAQLGIPWVEVAAELEHQQEPPWHPQLPIPFLQYSPRTPWVCPSDTPEPAAASPRRHAPHRPEPFLPERLQEWKVRIVDVYSRPPSEPRTRRLFWMLLDATEDQAGSLLLVYGPQKREITTVRYTDGIEHAEYRLHQKFRETLQRWGRHHHAIYDSPMNWAAPRDLFRNSRTEYVSPDLYPPRYRRISTSSWRVIPGMKDFRWQIKPALTPEQQPVQEDLFAAPALPGESPATRTRSTPEQSPHPPGL